MSAEVSIQLYTQSILFDQAKKKTLNKLIYMMGYLKK